MVLRLLLFPEPGVPLSHQIFSDITKSSYNTALYIYMGVGTALVMAFLGFYIGRSTDELHERAVELDALHNEVASQKELFENRYKVLDNNIKNFHLISSRIQKSIKIEEVLALCAEGLHDILGYERVNILMADADRTALRFVAATGSAGFDLAANSLPLDNRIGVLWKCIAERKLYFVEDINRYSSDYHLQSPFNTISPLRSRSFVICPIVVKGESIGVFGIDNKFSSRSLNDTDVDTIRLFADQAASAITRINLLGAIDTLTRELGRTFTDFLRNREENAQTFYKLKGAVDSLSGNTNSIATASESVLSSVEDTSSAVSEISVAIEQVTRNLDFLSDSIDKSVSAMEEINATLRNVKQNTVVSHKVSSRVKEQADKSRIVVNETIASLAEIQQSVDLSYEGICRLSDNSSRIDGIVNVINDITKRTNLLALNASIIAAQAGEYGKSFGVVADEIRNLSLQTGQSTGEITGIIEEILAESRQAATSIAMTRDLVQKGVLQGEETGKALQVILESSVQAMDMTEQINVSTEEQAKSIGLITQSMEDVSTMTSQIFNASKEQSQATRNIAKSVDSIKQLAKGVVESTGRQVIDGAEIKRSMDAVGDMVIGIFDEMEKRREQSALVVCELELIKREAE
jgi:methyl-accepting chemotaxis protein